MRMKVPKRIKQIWCKSVGNGSYWIHLTQALAMADVSADEFRKCWQVVQLRIPRKEFFRLFKKAFGQNFNLPCRVAFVKDMVRRYKAMGEPVCECLACLSFVSVCPVGAARNVVVQACHVSSTLASLSAQSVHDD